MPRPGLTGLLCLLSVLLVPTLVLSTLGPIAAHAQTPGDSKKRSGSVEGSPLDTILSTRLWTTPAPAQDFVRETRPDPGSIDYTPLHGVEPARPKPRDAASVKALQAELEHDIELNEKRALPLGGVTQAGRRAQRPQSGGQKPGIERPLGTRLLPAKVD